MKNYLSLTLIFLCLPSSLHSTRITLISFDNKHFQVDRAVARQSVILSTCLSDSNDDQPIRVQVHSKTLQKILALMSLAATAQPDSQLEKIDVMRKIAKKTFNKNRLDHEINAANYLDIPVVLQGLLQTLVLQLKRPAAYQRPVQTPLRRLFDTGHQPYTTLAHILQPDVAETVVAMGDLLGRKNPKKKLTRRSSIADLLERGIIMRPNGEGVLRLNVQSLYGLPKLIAMIGAKKVTTLNICGAPLSHINRQDFEGLMYVKSIDLSYSNLCAVEAGAFSQLPRIRSLNLHDTPISNNRQQLDQIYGDVGVCNKHTMIRL